LKEKYRNPTADSIGIYTRIESASGVETIVEIDVKVGAPGKAKGTSEGFTVNQSIIDRPSETQKGGYHEIGGWLSLAVRETDRVGEGGHGKNRKEDGGVWYVGERGK
jgi:hypothetical protein